MLTRYTFWLTAAILFMFLAAVLHSISFFIVPELSNESELQLYTLMTTYRSDLGLGFSPSLWDLFRAFSFCFPLLCLSGGSMLGYLLLRHLRESLMRPLIAIQLAIFGVCLIVFVFFTFFPPIAMTALVVVNLGLAYFFCPAKPLEDDF